MYRTPNKTSMDWIDSINDSSPGFGGFGGLFVAEHYRKFDQSKLE
jgi:hypothetical protein